jgi:hypothetical protein
MAVAVLLELAGQINHQTGIAVMRLIISSSGMVWLSMSSATHQEGSCSDAWSCRDNLVQMMQYQGSIHKAWCNLQAIRTFKLCYFLNLVQMTQY